MFRDFENDFAARLRSSDCLLRLRRRESVVRTLIFAYSSLGMNLVRPKELISCDAVDCERDRE
jgi:hypothetical protein